MAGNLVKWWKHKILGGYKQFSVQECTTDSEELMYHQVRASSSCSAPPDLLLVSDRENNMPLRSPVVNIIATTTTAPATTTTSPSSGINACHITSAANNNQHRYQQHQQQQQKLQHHHQQQQQQQHHQHQVTTQQLSLAYNNGCKDIIGNTGGGINAAGGSGKHQKQSVIVGSSSSTSKHGHQQQQQTPDMQPSAIAHDIVDGQPFEAQTNNHSSTKQTHHHTQQQHHNQRSEEHIRLEEFTCDVSVEGGKSSQPLQFSFTFYDLDGHHGKITKDDIVGIVYTIYESIGKSVVVPHSGSKTINVRLTVSPEGKTKATKNKKALDHHSLNLNQKPTADALASTNNTQASRRLHRYRPRKLIKSDEEDDDSNSDKERDLNLSHILAHKAASKAHKLGKLKTSEQHCCSQQMAHHQQQQQQHQQPALNDLPNSPLDTAGLYDNLKASSPLEACRECLAAVADETRNAAATSPLVSAATTTTSPAQFPAASSKTTNEAYMKHVASTRIKMLRKSRKQKHQDCLETRQRSLSVGNETCWKNRHLQTKHSNSSNTQQQQLLWQAEQHLNNSIVVGGGNGNGNGNGNGVDMVDGFQMRNPLKNTKSMMTSSSSSAHKRNSAECWKTALNRNDLISIIRESMEKNRLCFQLNGKPQANVSPIRQQTNINTNNPHQQTQPHNPQAASSNSSKHSQQHQTTPIVGSQQQRQRSNTISKIPTLIANHNNTQSAAISPQHHHAQRSSSCANTISNNCNNHNHSHSHSHSHDTSLANEPYSHSNSSNSSNNHHYHHHQPHIPIYHQQMAINPAVIAAQNALLTATASGNIGSSLLQQHGKMNLCGYDSFLHATICGGGLSHSPPPPPSAPLPAQNSTNHTILNTQITVSSNSNLSQQHHQHQQQIATVQPIMAQNASTSKHLSLAVTPQQLKSSKILRQTSNSTPSQSQHQNQHHSYTNTTQNSPQYHGYQRLPSSSKHNLSALHLLSPNTEKPSLSELDKWRRDQVKSYDQLLYAKLSEKLQQTNLVSSSANVRDCNQRRKQRVNRQRRTTALQQDDQAITNNSLPSSTQLSNSICLREPTDYNSVIPIVGDPVECENLLGQTSDEDINSPQDINPSHKLKAAVENRQVAEATLVDIDKITDELTAQKANLTLNVDTLLSVDDTEEVHNLHSLHEDELEIDEDLEDEEELDEELEDLGQIVESGRNSNNSNNSSNANTANTTNTATNNGANNSTSSLIHRYVHEHIHHHYHHFEEKEE